MQINFNRPIQSRNWCTVLRIGNALMGVNWNSGNGQISKVVLHSYFIIFKQLNRKKKTKSIPPPAHQAC